MRLLLHVLLLQQLLLVRVRVRVHVLARVRVRASAWASARVWAFAWDEVLGVRAAGARCGLRVLDLQNGIYV